MALKGIIVLEFEAMPPLQFTGQMLADQGAQVIVIRATKKGGQKQMYLSRGKTVINLNLKKDRDRAFLVQDVIPHIDVILESYRPGVMENLGLAPEIIHDANHKLVYARMSGYGQFESKYRDLAGHDINYLALTGVLNRFKRVAKNSTPAIPGNIVADFASASLYSFNLILQALYVRKPHTVLDCSITHSTAYLSQLEILETIKVTNRDRSKNKNSALLTSFARPHESVYRDQDGVCFVLKPGTKIHDDAKLQHYSPDESSESHKHQDLYQLVFEKMTVKDIVQKYGPVEIVESLENVATQYANKENGLVVKDSEQSFQIMNVFENNFKTYNQTSQESIDGWKKLEEIGVLSEKIQKFQELKISHKKQKAEKSDFKHKL